MTGEDNCDWSQSIKEDNSLRLTKPQAAEYRKNNFKTKAQENNF